MTELIENYFKEIKGIYDGIFIKDEGKWFNGRTFYPLYNYNIKSEKLYLEYTYQSNEYSTSNALLPSKVDIHKVQMNYSFTSQLNDKFTISSRYNLLTLLLKGKNGYKVFSSDKQLTNYLNEDLFIKDIFSSYFDPEFSPVIIGEVKNNRYAIQIQFNLIRFNPEIFSLINQFIMNFEHKYG